LITSVIEQLPSKYRNFVAARREIARLEKQPTGLLNKSIKEINSKSRNQISLKYFDTTKREIYSFFNRASEIVEGHSILSTQKSAMVSIVNGCKTLSDVQIKKADLFTLMKNNQIELEQNDIDVAESRNYCHNIFDNNILENLKAKLGYDVHEDLMLLNNINLRRNVKKENDFSNIGCIFLTGNKNIMKLSFDPAIRKNGTVPLATTLEWLTNKFWFKMNKGFGQDKTPHNTNIMFKSQMVLSAIIGETLADKQKELMQETKNGILSKEKAQNRLIELRKIPHTPEEITESNINQVFDFLTEDELEKAVHEQESLKIIAQEQEKENRELQQQIKDSADTTFATKKEMLKMSKESKETLDMIHKEISRNVKLRKIGVNIICIISLALLVLFLTNMINLILMKFTDHQIAVISIIVSIITFIISTILSIVNYKKVAVISFIKKIYERIEKEEYKKRKFNLLDYSNLGSKIEALEKELNS
jgi:hypothetical protein